MEHIELEYEVRLCWYGGLMVSSHDIQMIRFDLEMKQHFQQEREKHEDIMYALKLKSWYEFWK